MHVVSLLAMAVQEQVPFTPASADDGRMWLWIALGVGVLALVAALMLARAVIAVGYGNGGDAGDLGCDPRGGGGFSEAAVQDDRGDCARAGGGAVLWVSLVAEDGAICAEDGDEFSGGCGVLGAGGVYGDVLLDPREYTDGFGGAHEFECALRMALHGGAVTGLVVVALSLLGVGVLFLFFGGLENPQTVPYQLVGFGFGASLVALFAQLGGGIYTKAADVGADLVGKVEAGIPEDDPRNPAVIADLVGDNVGDCAGRGADIFESTAAENVGAMILGAALYPVFGVKGILFPLIVLRST